MKSFLQWEFFGINPDFIRFWGAVLRVSPFFGLCFNRFSCDLRDVSRQAAQIADAEDAPKSKTTAAICVFSVADANYHCNNIRGFEK